MHKIKLWEKITHISKRYTCQWYVCLSLYTGKKKQTVRSHASYVCFRQLDWSDLRDSCSKRDCTGPVLYTNTLSVLLPANCSVYFELVTSVYTCRNTSFISSHFCPSAMIFNIGHVDSLLSSHSCLTLFFKFSVQVFHNVVLSQYPYKHFILAFAYSSNSKAPQS